MEPLIAQSTKQLVGKLSEVANSGKSVNMNKYVHTMFPQYTWNRVPHPVCFPESNVFSIYNNFR